VANDQQGYKGTLKAFQRSLNWLQTDYLDLYLIHWPQGKLSLETWKAMEELYDKGLIRAIGVSNYWIHHLEYFLPHCRVTPAVNQVEFHPHLQQPKLLEYCRERNIQVEAWSPIMQGKVIKIPKIREIAAKHGKTPVQVVLRWDIQKGVITIPRSGIESEIIANADIFDFNLDEEDMAKIESLNKNKKIEPYYDKISFLFNVLINNRKKIPVFFLLFKATAFKIWNRIKLMFALKEEPKLEEKEVALKNK
jgi:methylglyoxal/glyoxal reductase